MKKAIITILAISLFSCNSQKNIKADYEVNKNETFEISLKSNPSTGYSWKWIKNKNSKILDSISSNYIPTKVKEGIVGSGGNEIWKFKGNNSGIDTLQLQYCRSWDKNSTIETKKFVVIIK
jgi:inhibitor of cysteine peptidase